MVSIGVCLEYARLSFPFPIARSVLRWELITYLLWAILEISKKVTHVHQLINPWIIFKEIGLRNCSTNVWNTDQHVCLLFRWFNLLWVIQTTPLCVAKIYVKINHSVKFLVLIVMSSRLPHCQSNASNDGFYLYHVTFFIDLMFSSLRRKILGLVRSIEARTSRIYSGSTTYFWIFIVVPLGSKMLGHLTVYHHIMWTCAVPQRFFLKIFERIDYMRNLLTPPKSEIISALYHVVKSISKHCTRCHRIEEA